MNDLISRHLAIDAVCMEWCNVKHQDCKHPFDAEKDDYYWCDGCETALQTLPYLPSAQPEYRLDEWCTDCKEYDTEKHCCPRFNQVIRTTLNEMKSERKKGKWIVHDYALGRERYECAECKGRCDLEYNFCPHCGADMRGGQDD